MEDRHTISVPRIKTPNINAELVWLVDIYRKGVSDPIETLEITEDSLPPRTNKRGKIVWRLPKDPEKLPNFATDERRRIMELFKEQKKNRRKRTAVLEHGDDDTLQGHGPSESHTEVAEGSANKEDGGDSGGGDGVLDAYGLAAALALVGNMGFPDADPGSGADQNGGDAIGATSVGDDGLLLAPAVSKASKSKKKKKKKKTFSRQSSGVLVDDGTGKESPPNVLMSVEDPVVTTPNGATTTVAAPAATTAAAPLPPGLGQNETLSNKPRMDQQQNPSDSNLSFRDDVTQLHHESNMMDASTSPMKQPPSDPPARPSQPTKAPPNNNNNNNHQTPLQPPTITRSIVIPHRDRPIPSLTETDDPPSLAVAAAKAFVDLYYPHISHGLSSDLSMYYTRTAQKSISIGGAHSVVACKADITLQLSSLAGSSFLCRGVVAQDLLNGRGAHVLITGVVQTPLSELATPFAHSVSLVPTTTTFIGGVAAGGPPPPPPLQQSMVVVPYSFQIHNDALSLLTAGDMVTQQQPQPQPMQTQMPQPQTAQQTTTSAAAATTTTSSIHEPMTHATDPFSANHRQPPGLFG